MTYHNPPLDYSPPTACEECGRRIIFGPVVGGHIWSHLVEPDDDYHIVQMRPEGYFDTFTGKTVLGNPLRRTRTNETNVSKMSEFPEDGNKRSVEMIEEGLCKAREALAAGDEAVAAFIKSSNDHEIARQRVIEGF